MLILFNWITYAIGGYKKCHSFEFFTEGTVHMKEYEDSDASKSYTHEYISNKASVNMVKTNLLRDMFGENTTCLEHVDMKTLKLEKSPVQPIKSNKINSIKTVLFAVPKTYRAYYPGVKVNEELVDDENENGDDAISNEGSASKSKPKKSKSKVNRVLHEFNPSTKSKSTVNTSTNSIRSYLIGKDNGITNTPANDTVAKTNIVTKDVEMFKDLIMTPPPYNSNSDVTGSRSMSSVSNIQTSGYSSNRSDIVATIRNDLKELIVIDDTQQPHLDLTDTMEVDVTNEDFEKNIPVALPPLLGTDTERTEEKNWTWLPEHNLNG